MSVECRVSDELAEVSSTLGRRQRCRLCRAWSSRGYLAQCEYMRVNPSAYDRIRFLYLWEAATTLSNSSNCEIEGWISFAFPFGRVRVSPAKFELEGWNSLPDTPLPKHSLRWAICPCLRVPPV